MRTEIRPGAIETTTKRWKRRKPRFPVAAVLVGLFGFTLAVPYCWKRPVLNVHSLMQQRLSAELALLETRQIPPDELPPAADFLVFTVPVPPAIEPLPCRPVADFQGVNTFCGAFSGIFGEDNSGIAQRELPEIEQDESQQLLDELLAPTSPPVEQTPLPPFPTVRISSFSDRLAMVVKRLPSISQISSPIPGPAVEPEADSSAPSATEAEPQVEESRPPQVAMRPRHQDVSEALPEEESPQEPADSVFRTPLVNQKPDDLLRCLHALVATRPAGPWAQTALGHVEQLTVRSELSLEDSSSVLDALEQLAGEGKERALEIAEPGIQQSWLQAAQGLGRRVGIWRALLSEAAGSEFSEVGAPATAPMAVCLSELIGLLNGSDMGEQWREYLLLDELVLATSDGVGVRPNERIELAQEVLARMHDERLTEAQRQFLAEGPMPDFVEQLRIWAAGPVDLQLLLALVERYEQNGQLRYARAISQLCQRMTWSDDERLQQLADDLQEHYRGANMRIAISSDMLNRMVPDQQIENAIVRETIAGHKVKGRSRTSTTVHVSLVPAEGAWKIGLEADGRVYSQTRSDTWPVKVRNAARFEYEAEKIITIDGNGLHIGRATSEARGRNEFLGADSMFDRVPIFGAMFDGIAKKQNERSRPTAIRQVKAKVAYTARTKMDNQADPRLTQLEQKFRDHVLAPFGQLALSAEPLDLYTTEERAVMRLRLANLDQLAAHSPRPSAPSDSLVSMQLHETALNNALAGLELEGKRTSLVHLFQMLAEKFGREAELPDDLSRRAIVEFAPYDAVHVSFTDDRLELVLNIRELAQGRDRIRDFQAHAFYRPAVQGLTVRLVRDDTLQFSGRDLKTGPRIVLHSVMGKLFAQNESIPIVKQTIEQDQRLAGLMITQLVIEDGWLALAVGPESQQRVAWRTPIYHLEDISR